MLEIKDSSLNYKVIGMFHKETSDNIMVIFPGGGYTHNEEYEGESIAQAFYTQGYDAVVMRYIDKCEKRLSYNELQIKIHNMFYNLKIKWGCDEKKMIFIGFSAGAHVALLSNLHFKYLCKGLILLYPLVSKSITDLWDVKYPDVMSLINDKTPPVFIASTWDDHIIPIRHLITLLDTLDHNNVSTEVHFYQKGHHGMALGERHQEDGKIFSTWFSLCKQWINRL